MKNIPLPPFEINYNMIVIKVGEAMKNALIIGLDIVLIRVKNAEDDIKSITNNFISKRDRI